MKNVAKKSTFNTYRISGLSEQHEITLPFHATAFCFHIEPTIEQNIKQQAFSERSSERQREREQQKKIWLRLPNLLCLSHTIRISFVFGEV